MNGGTISIAKGREKPVLNRHPWVFSGAITHAAGADPGSIITLVDHQGQFLARGYWNARSQIQVRILTWQDEPINADWWRRMLAQAVSLRPAGPGRLINAENDYLPGLIVDRYDDWLVLQSLTLGIEAHKSLIVEILADLLHPRGIYERSDVEVRGKEGLEPAAGLLWGEAPPQRLVIDEGVRLYVDLYKGHKTGTYLDQAANRRLLSQLLATNARVLNLFSYTGGFGLHALQVPGAQVTDVDSSPDALHTAHEALSLNNYEPDRVQHVQADAFDYLRYCLEAGQQFDAIVLDPPKFAHSKSQVDRASRGYKDLNLHAFRLLRPGGRLMTFSCSGAITPDLFQKIVFGAMVDAGRHAQIIRHLGPADDHPVALTFPEGAYLKGLLLRVF